MSLLRVLQEHVQEEAHGPEQGAGLAFDELPEFIQHHIGDAREIEFGGGHWSLEALSIPQFQIGGITIDLSPTRQTLVMMAVAILLMAIFIPVARVMRKRGPERAPSGFSNAVEALVVYFRDDIVRTNIRHGADAFTPFILTIFFFVLGMNLAGLTPLGITPTANLSVTATLALISFAVTEVSGFRAQGAAGYARTIFYIPAGLPTFMKPVMLVIMTPVEFMGKLTKPFALAVRLLANMTAGHTLLLAVMGMILAYQSYAIGFGAVVIASGLMILELFVAFLQAYIFAMLTSVFIGLMQHAH